MSTKSLKKNKRSINHQAERFCYRFQIKNNNIRIPNFCIAMDEQIPGFPKQYRNRIILKYLIDNRIQIIIIFYTNGIKKNVTGIYYIIF